jgi:hypothetical protein
MQFHLHGNNIQQNSNPASNVSPTLEDKFSFQHKQRCPLSRKNPLKWVVLIISFFNIINLHAQEIDLPSIIVESDTLDLSFWTQQQHYEETWDTWLKPTSAANTKYQVNNRILSGWSAKHRDYRYAQFSKVNYDKLSLGLSVHKAFNSSIHERDWSSYCCLKDIGCCRKLIIGDYRMYWGEGLIFGQRSTNNHFYISPRNQITASGFIRGAATHVSIRMMDIILLEGVNPLFTDFEQNQYKMIYNTSTNSNCTYLSSGNKITGVALNMGNNHANIGYLSYSQLFSYEFTDSLFKRRNRISSYIYCFETGSISVEGEMTASGKINAMMHTFKLGNGSFNQQVEYYNSDAYFPSWFRGNSIHKPSTFNSNMIQYKISGKLGKYVDLKSSFTYEKRDVFGTNNISKQYMKIRYHDNANNCLLSFQHRVQPSSIANDSTFIHDSLPLDILRVQWDRTLSSEWNLGFIFQDKYYQTNSGFRKHGFYLTNSFCWSLDNVKAQLQITMMQTKSSVFISNDFSFDTEQWQMGDDLSYQLSVQILKKIPVNIVYAGSFWKRGREQVQVEIAY